MTRMAVIIWWGLVLLTVMAKPGVADDAAQKLPPPGYSYFYQKPDKCHLGPILIPERGMTDAEYDQFADEVAKRQTCDPDAKSAPDPKQLIADFAFTDATCTDGPLSPPAGRLTADSMDALNRQFAKRKVCEDKLNLADQQAVDDLIRKLGGSSKWENGNFSWGVPFECGCKGDMAAIINKMQAREQTRMTAYQADIARVQQKVRTQFGHN